MGKLVNIGEELMVLRANVEIGLKAATNPRMVVTAS